MLMINNQFARFQLSGNLLKTKKMCSLFPWIHAISYLFATIIIIMSCIFCKVGLSDQRPQPLFPEGKIHTLPVNELPSNFWVAVGCTVFFIDNLHSGNQNSIRIL
jgi:hypothetical protein